MTKYLGSLTAGEISRKEVKAVERIVEALCEDQIFLEKNYISCLITLLYFFEYTDKLKQVYSKNFPENHDKEIIQHFVFLDLWSKD